MMMMLMLVEMMVVNVAGVRLVVVMMGMNGVGLVVVMVEMMDV